MIGGSRLSQRLREHPRADQLDDGLDVAFDPATRRDLHDAISSGDDAFESYRNRISEAHDRVNNFEV